MRRTTMFSIAVLLLAATMMLAHAATISVTNTNDSGPGSLRQALANANNGDTINFAVTGTIALTSGGLQVTKNVTISGPGSNQLSIDGNQALFVFGIFPQRTVSISGLSIRNAQVGVYNNQGTLSVSNCVLSGNSSAGLANDGGQGSGGASMTVANTTISNNSGIGVYNNAVGGSGGASMTVTNSIISNNSGTGVDNLLPFLGTGCACMTIIDSIVSNNAENGIYNLYSSTFLSGGSAVLTVVNSNVSDNGGSGIRNDGTEGGQSATIVNTTVSGNSAGGIFTPGTFLPAKVTVTDSTISGNSTYGGIHGGFEPTFTNSTISGNSSEESGGGIYGVLRVENSTISGNSAGTSGGGIYGSPTVKNSTISGNLAGTSGGGIYDDGGLSIENSTISGNSSAESGGGIYTIAAGIVNSTISGNSAGISGGGIYKSTFYLFVRNSTITGNSAGSGGGVYNTQGQSGNRVLFFSNVILNAGASGENIFNDGGTVTSAGYNLSSDDGGGYLTGPGDQINTDPLLGPLQNNGGPTLTHALLPGSPAIDAGDPNFSPPPLYDQRGCPFARVFNGRIDIGSFEIQPPPRRPCPRPRPSPVPRPTPR